MTQHESGIQAAFWVAPSGSDQNAGTEAQPFATLDRARDAVRTVNRDMTGDIVVWLREGTYPLQCPVTFGPLDSGSNGHDVVYRSSPGEKAVFSGGRRVTEWRLEADGLWTALLDAANVRQVYVNGRRAARAGIKAPVGLEPWGLHGYRTRYDAAADWPFPEDLEFCYEYVWCHTRCKVDSIRRNGEYAEIRMRQPCFVLANSKEGVQIPYPTMIENSRAFLTTPGQWYFDPRKRVLHYLPGPEERIEDTVAIVPVVEKLLDLRGTLEEPVRNLRFEGITFTHATWLQPCDNGFVDLQANFTLEAQRLLFAREGARSPGCIYPLHGECNKSPANIVCHAAQSLRFERCTFTALGGAGLDLEYGSRDNVITECDFFDISGSALQVGDVQREDHHPDDPRAIVRNNAITHNRIHEVALEFKGGVGVFAGYTDGTLIAHNEISHLPYSAVSIGWGWGETDAGGGAYAHPSFFSTPTPSANNRIEKNHIHHVMLDLDDGGAIYTLGEMPGTVIRGNHIHDNKGMPGGIYLDEGSGHIEVTGNVVYNVQRPLNFNNHTQNRFATCVVHDNFESRPEDTDSAADIVANAGPRPED